MPQDLFVTIKSHYNTFTRAEKHIADYVLASAREVLYMSITELANVCDVGDTSVFRFCRHLGKSGYQDFKVDLAQAVSDSNTMPMLESCIVDTADTADVMIQKVLNNNIAVLRETYQLIDPMALTATTRWLSEANRICFFGVGASSTSAMEASNRFMRVCPKVEYVMDARMQLMRAALMDKNDVAVLFSYSGATRETVAIARTARAAGAKCICISRFARSPLAELCDITYLCGGNDGPLQSGSLSVKISQLLLMEVLYIAYCQANPDTCDRYRQLTATVHQLDKL